MSLGDLEFDYQTFKCDYRTA